MYLDLPKQTTFGTEGVVFIIKVSASGVGLLFELVSACTR
jgi:hypothetical protein